MNRVRITTGTSSMRRYAMMQIIGDYNVAHTTIHVYPDIGGDLVAYTTVFSPLLKYNGTIVFIRPDDAYRLAHEILAPFDFARPQMRIAA